MRNKLQIGRAVQLQELNVRGYTMSEAIDITTLPLEKIKDILETVEGVCNLVFCHLLFIYSHSFVFSFTLAMRNLDQCIESAKWCFQ